MAKASRKTTASTTSKTTVASVADHIQQLDHPLQQTVAAIRTMILQTDKEIGEQIKWNSPAFYYTGEMKPFDPKEYKRDIVVMNLRKKEYVLLVFPTGARVADNSGLLEGSYADGRRMVTVTSLEDLRTKEKALQGIIKAWLKEVE